MHLRSGFEYTYTASSTTSTRRSRKRKSVDDDELDERPPLKRQHASLDVVDEEDPSGLSHPAPFVASPPPSPSHNPLLSPTFFSIPDTPLVMEDGDDDSDATVPIDDDSSDETVALEDESDGIEGGPRQVRFHNSVIEYLFEADDEPRRVVELRRFAYLRDAQ